MRLELKDMKDPCLQQELTFVAADFPVLAEMELHDGVRFDVPIQFRLRYQKSGQIVEVDGQFSTCVSLSCGHCLQSFSEELVGDFALTFSPYVAGKDEPSGEEADIELETDELGLVYYRDETLELLPTLQEQVVMALPISPICSDGCRGLCLVCGCNLNVDKCQCEKKVFNNKFTTLAGLKIKSSED